MNRNQLVDLIKKKKSFLCVGLDSDIDKVPDYLKKEKDPVFEFNKRIIDATLPYAVAYKPNLAFYESNGSAGIISLEKTIQYLLDYKEQVFTIADAKRCDIGNSAAAYAKAFFSQMEFDAVTVSPYMGYDSIHPFLAYKDKWTIILAITSNNGAEDFQKLEIISVNRVESGSSEKLYENIIRKSLTWENNEQIMFVAGATQAKLIGEIRNIAPGSFLLVPGVGAQGGSLKEVAELGLNNDCGLLINASRSIIFASDKSDFDFVAASEAKRLQSEMEALLKAKGII